jgi:hypothetical protein
MGAKKDLTREELIQLLTELGAELHSRGVRGELFIVGGAAMALAFDARRLTSDVDAVFEPRSVIADAAQTVASRHPGLDSGWLNDAMKGFLPGWDTAQQVILDVAGLRATVPSPEYLLAMKVQASRVDRDEDDITFLANHLGLHTAAAVFDVVERFYPRSQLLPKTQFFIEQIFD